MSQGGWAADPCFAAADIMAKLIQRGGLLLLHPSGRICVSDHSDLQRRLSRETHALRTVLNSSVMIGRSR